MVGGRNGERRNIGPRRGVLRASRVQGRDKAGTFVRLGVVVLVARLGRAFAGEASPVLSERHTRAVTGGAPPAN